MGTRLGAYIEAGQTVTVLHLGDHDPSGIDMTRDIYDRIATFIAVNHVNTMLDDGEIHRDAELVTESRRVLERFSVDRIALNMDQIEQYQPPPNPAKLTDVRAAGYVKEHGYSSWGLDALEPTVLVGLIRDAIAERRDLGTWEDSIAEEDEHKEILQSISDNWYEVKEMLEERS